MNPRIVPLSEIKKVLPTLDLIPPIEKGFVDYSTGKAIVPPVGELLLNKGDVHIKYGYIEQENYYVIKIASGFYDNPSIDLPSGNGLMLLFSQVTGELVSILMDEGILTDIRTAIAGAIAAKHLAPKEVKRIGIVGTGNQARLQLMYLSHVTPCRKALVWGRGEAQVAAYRMEIEKHGFSIETTLDSSEILRHCNLVVTTTPATEPLLFAADIHQGVHITAVGSDTPTKQELDPAILKKADLVVADSISQCLLRGEIHQAVKQDFLMESEPIELGNLIRGQISGRLSDSQITVADLTGVAVQDIKIATAVFEQIKKTKAN
jgi:ornithine cyclodeaminase